MKMEVNNLHIDVRDIIRKENLVYSKTPLMTDTPLSYCPGCGHGTAHRIVMEVIEEMGIQKDVIGVAPVGCSSPGSESPSEQEVARDIAIIVAAKQKKRVALAAIFLCEYSWKNAVLMSYPLPLRLPL